MPDIRVLRERCVACRDCIDLCPQSGDDVEFPVLAMDGIEEISVQNTEGCIGCFTCVEFCRAAAIVISGSTSRAPSHPGLYPTRPTSRII
jgi:Fe-S-cluster-containing hydrogenase component 2